MISVAISGKQIPKPLVRANVSRGNKRSLYRTKSHDSQVDETLFGSPARYSDQKETPRVLADDVSWDPPWVTSPSKTGVPLLWTPFDSKGLDKSDSASMVSGRRNPESTTPRTPTSARNKYRLRKLVPSYVDETLFGTPPKEPDFDAPWETDENRPTSCQVAWSPPLVVSNHGTPKGSARIQVKSKASSGYGISPHAATRPYTPVIKARPGSAINTPESRFKQKKRVPMRATPFKKLDFGKDHEEENVDENLDDPDAIVERALKLAGIYSSRVSTNRHRSNSLGSLSSRAPSPGGYFWKRPPSAASSTGKSESANPRETAGSPHDRKPPELELDEIFSATGRQMTLSARSIPHTPRSRPSSARSEKTLDSVPGLDLTKPPKMYGYRRPASARSARSVSSMASCSPISNRPSWRP